jgi:sortase A
MGNRAGGLARVLRAFEWVLLVIGLMSIGWYGFTRISAAREQAALSHELDRFAGSERRPAGAVPTLGVVGRIEVPRLNLSAVAREGVDVRTLRVAVGHIPGTAFPGEDGNAGFAAHRDTFFRPLKAVRTGDEVIVTTARGVYHYAVTGVRIVAPDEVSVLDTTSAAVLTLVTCYPFDYIGSAPQRFIVRAALQTSPSRMR